MARITRNSILNGISGRLGDVVFRQVNGQTIVSMAESGKRGPGSEKQQEQRGRMHLAKLYAKAELLDPAVKALYATGITSRLTNARLVAITDFMNAPQITAADLNAYHGQPGDPIRIQATDDFAVVAVRVRICTALGELVLDAAAAPQPDGSWLFHAPAAGPAQPGTRIAIEAQDRPGNRTCQRYILEEGGWLVVEPEPQP